MRIQNKMTNNREMIQFYSLIELIKNSQFKLTKSLTDEYQQLIESESLDFVSKFTLFRTGYNHSYTSVLNDNAMFQPKKIYQYLYLMDCYYSYDNERDDHFISEKMNQLMIGELDEYEYVILFLMIKSEINIDYSKTTQASLISTALLLNYFSAIDINDSLAVVYHQVIDIFNRVLLENKQYNTLQDNLLLELYAR